MNERFDKLTELAVAKLRAAIQDSDPRLERTARALGQKPGVLLELLAEPLKMLLRDFITLCGSLGLKILAVQGGNGDSENAWDDDRSILEEFADDDRQPPADVLERRFTTGVHLRVAATVGLQPQWPQDLLPELEALSKELVYTERWASTGPESRRHYLVLLRTALQRAEKLDKPPEDGSVN